MFALCCSAWQFSFATTRGFQSFLTTHSIQPVKNTYIWSFRSNLQWFGKEGTIISFSEWWWYKNVAREILAWSGSTTCLCSRTNYVSVLCMGPTTNIQSYAQYTYMIGREYNHVVLPDHVSISHVAMAHNPPPMLSREIFRYSWSKKFFMF